MHLKVNSYLCKHKYAYFLSDKTIFWKNSVLFTAHHARPVGILLFLVLQMLFVWHYSTQWSSGTAPVLLATLYSTPVVTSWSTRVLKIWKGGFQSQAFINLALLPPFLRLAWCLHFNLEVTDPKHSPNRLLVWITAIHEIFICNRFYIRARAGQS